MQEIEIKDISSMYEILEGDLRNELTHMHFYLQSASLVQGLHAKEYKDHLLEESAKEMKHVSEFYDMMIGIGAQNHITNRPYQDKLPKLNNPKDILRHALGLEEEVVSNYCKRIKQVESLQCVDGAWLHIFMEKQVEASRVDVDELRQIIKGIEAGF